MSSRSRQAGCTARGSANTRGRASQRLCRGTLPRHRALSATAILLATSVAASDLCPADDNCNNNRICELGSLEAFDSVLLRVMEYAGCSPACVGQCDCVCNQSGVVWEALTSDPIPYCSALVCSDPGVVRMMNFPATEFECDAVLAIALRPIYQLCGKTNGICQYGECQDENCIRTVDNKCLQTATGVDSTASYIIGALAVVDTILFLWAWTALAVAEDVEALVHSSKPPPYKSYNDDDDDVFTAM